MRARRSQVLLGAALLLAFTAGPAAAYFERTAVGARGSAMGAGAIALVRDVSSYYWNPAALALLDRPGALADYSQPYGISDLNANAVAFAMPAFGTGWGAGWHRFGLSGAYAEDQFTLSAGRAMWTGRGHRIAAGATFKYGRISFGDFDDPVSGAAVDIPTLAKGSLDTGLLWATPWSVDLAWVGRDLLRPRYVFVPGSGGDVLQTRHEFAAALRWNRESTITMGWSQPEEGAASLNAGIEILFFDVFAIRSGITNVSNVYQSLSSPTDMQFTGGFGVFHKGYYVDASATTNRDLGASYQVSLHIPIGGASPR